MSLIDSVQPIYLSNVSWKIQSVYEYFIVTIRIKSIKIRRLCHIDNYRKFFLLRLCCILVFAYIAGSQFDFPVEVNPKSVLDLYSDIKKKRLAKRIVKRKKIRYGMCESLILCQIFAFPRGVCRGI